MTNTDALLYWSIPTFQLEYLYPDILGRVRLRGWLRGGRGVVDVSQLRAGVYSVIPVGTGHAPLRILKQ